MPYTDLTVTLGLIQSKCTVCAALVPSTTTDKALHDAWHTNVTTTGKAGTDTVAQIVQQLVRGSALKQGQPRGQQ